MTHVALIAPSYKVSEEDIRLGKTFFEDLGMKATAFITLGSDLFCSHTDEVRFSDLRHALEDPSVDLIWALRGGYGLTRLVPYLLSLEKPEKEKLFVGFSDGSILHTFLNQAWGWKSLHAPVVTQLFRNLVGYSSIKETLRVVREGLDSCRLAPLRPLNKVAQQMSRLEGKVVGGNLCLTTCGFGTELQLNTEGKILFFEDLDERGYSVDRMLRQVQQARLLDKAKALVFGDFVGGEEPDGSSLVDPVIQRFAAETPLPVFRLPDSGHGPENLPLPFNCSLVFSVEKR